MDFYRELWSRIGGRPWTYILRDLWHQWEWVPQLWWFLLGFSVAQFTDWRGVAIAWAIYTYGYLNGHIHWGTRYKPDQHG